MDYLDEWQQAMKELKWKLGQINNSNFQDVDQIYQTVRGFYGVDDFKKERLNPDNWLVHILANKQINSLKILGEHARLIDYYNSRTDLKSLNLKNRRGQINFREVNEKFFELYLSYIFTKSGIPHRFNESYFDDNRNSRPIDIAITDDEGLILVEATKFYDPFKEEFLELARHISRRIHTIANKNKLRPEEVFSGYLVFKKCNPMIVRQCKQIFEEKIKDHLARFRSVSLTINSVAKIENEEFKFLIEPAYIERQGHYADIVRDATASVVFRLVPNLQTGLVRGDFKMELSSEENERTKYLLEKIDEKIDQHSSFVGPKVIVVGIDHIFSTHKKASAVAILKDQVNSERVKEKLAKDTIVWLIFKTSLPGDTALDVTSICIRNDSDHRAVPYLQKINVNDLIVF